MKLVIILLISITTISASAQQDLPAQDWQQYLMITFIIAAVGIFIGSRLIMLRK